MKAALALALCLLSSAPTRAEAWHAVYDAYVAGANVVRLGATFTIDPAGYKVDVQARTLGVLDLFVGSRQSTQVEGIWHGALPRPRKFHAEGLWKGERRLTRIDYQDGLPTIRDLLPAEPNREPVPHASRRNTMDRVSPLAYLVQHMDKTGNCDATAITYDGKRLEETKARGMGWELLPSAGPSAFAGRAMRCDIELRLTAGFLADEDRAHAGRIRHAQVWLAAPIAGGPSLPVRFKLDVGWLGSATVYLSELRQISSEVK